MEMKTVREFLTYNSARDFSVEKYLFFVSALDEHDLIKLMVAENHDLVPGRDDSFIEVYDRVLPTMPEIEEDMILYLKHAYDITAKYITLTFLFDVALEYGDAIPVLVQHGARLLPCFALNYPDGDPEADVIIDTTFLKRVDGGWIYKAIEEA